MTYKIEANEQEHFVVRLFDEPPFIHPLEMAPVSREPLLNSGDWIVLAFAVWSKYDLQSVPLAIEFAKLKEGTLNLGLRPFEFAEEFSAWCELDMETSSFREMNTERTNDELHIKITGSTGVTPVWLFLRNGVILGQHQGLLDTDGLQRFTGKCLSMD